MLSLLDLIDAETVDLPLASYLAATMRSGASLLVGARPGGAGKTAAMCALLNFLPDRTVIRPVDSRAALADGQRAGSDQVCFLAHEISNAPYYAYVWGNEARAFFGLVDQGHIIASNLHADTLEETRNQLCRENAIPRAHLDAVTLKVYLQIERKRGWAIRRWVSRVYESDGRGDRLLWKGDKKGVFTRQEPPSSAIVSPAQERKYAQFLTALLRQDVRRIDDVRRALIQAAPDRRAPPGAGVEKV
jgi:hypothetical protein